MVVMTMRKKVCTEADEVSLLTRENAQVPNRNVALTFCNMSHKQWLRVLVPGYFKGFSYTLLPLPHHHPRCVPSRAHSAWTQWLFSSQTNRCPCSSAVTPRASISCCIPRSFPDTFHFSSPPFRVYLNTPSPLETTSMSHDVHMSLKPFSPSCAMGISPCDVGGLVLQSIRCILYVW